MAIRVYKPTSPARRFMSVLTFEEITKKKPEKSLTEIKKKHSGRNKQGKITVRHKGGGTRVYYRRIDFKRDKTDIPATVASIEYDPNRSAFIALLHYLDGEKRYILAPEGLKVGSKVISASSADIMPGNALPIENIPRRHPDPQCRDQGRPRRPNGPLRRDVRAVNGQGKRLCPGAPALGRAAQGADQRQGGPSASWAIPIMRTSASAKPVASATWASARRSAAS